MSIHPAEFIAVLSSDVQPERPRLRTTVAQAARFTRTRPPTLADVRIGLDSAVAMSLMLVGPTSGAQKTTLITGADVPLTRGAHGGTAAVAGRGAPSTARQRLGQLNTALFMDTRSTPSRAARAPGE